MELIVAGCINGFTPEEVELMIGLSLAADRPVNWNVLGVSPDNPDGWRRQLDSSSLATERGATIVALTLPHPMRLWLSLDTGFILDSLPEWGQVLHLPGPEKLKALADPEVRRRMEAGARSPEAGVLGRLARWDRLFIAETFTPEYKAVEGLTVSEAGARLGKEPLDALFDIVIADDLRTGLQPAAFGDDDASWQLRAEVWKDPRTVIGGSDAGAHLDLMCGAVYSTTLLGHAVRDRQLLSLESAIHYLTDAPARLYGLRGRGRISEGWAADVIVFDPDTIGPGPVHTRNDLPANAPRLYAEATGVNHVLVNGVEIATAGRATGEIPGTVLRSGRDTDTVHARQS
jgi:N-acyl-D-aspartate/D-glutamate deacylase